ncbi:hypothetical protein CTZ27_28195 [Streptomyces griseocarneus]|nr:hypothetical protein CTZ27_28195 [Streptomyces griseocarneus]
MALGAARQAAWALARTPTPPAWPRPDGTGIPAPADGGAAGETVRNAYARARTQVHGASTDCRDPRRPRP